MKKRGGVTHEKDLIICAAAALTASISTTYTVEVATYRAVYITASTKHDDWATSERQKCRSPVAGAIALALDITITCQSAG